MIKKHLNRLLVFAFLVLFIVSMRIMRQYADNVMEYNNEKILDLRMGYSRDDIINYINRLNDNGKDYYVKKFHLIDTFYPIIYGLFYILTLSYLIKRIFTKNRFVKFVLLIPVIGVICDYGENILLNSFVRNAENISKNMAVFSGYLTIAKFITLYFSLLLIIVSIVYFMIKMIKTRIYSKGKNGV
jgi:hypothetical protein